MNAVQTRRWTRSEYDRMIDAGILTSEDHVELIDGEVFAVTPQGSAHATSVSLAHDALRATLRQGAYIRTQLPLGLDVASEPEPDLAIVAGSARDHRDAHPQSALLVIEISDTTLLYDRAVKGSLYARAGVPEYWIINLAETAVEVYRDPVAGSEANFGWRYQSVERRGPGDFIAPLRSPEARISVDDLLP